MTGFEGWCATIEGAAALAIAELEVGPWRYTPATFAGGTGAKAAMPGSQWRVDLLRDGAGAAAMLHGGEREVAHAHAVLDDLPDRIERALAVATRELTRAPSAGSSPAGGAALSWSLSTSAPLRAPGRSAEAQLIRALCGAPVNASPRASAASLSWSSGAPDDEPGRLAQLLDRVADLARGRARIATHIEGALVAHSVTTLSGDTELWLASRLSLGEARLHARSVAIAVRTRNAWLRILTLLARAASRLVALGLPAGGVAALPVLWRFVRDVLAEIRARRPAAATSPRT